MTKTCFATNCLSTPRYGLLAIATSGTSTMAAISTEPYTVACGQHINMILKVASEDGHVVGVTGLTVKASA